MRRYSLQRDTTTQRTPVKNHILTAHPLLANAHVFFAFVVRVIIIAQREWGRLFSSPLALQWSDTVKFICDEIKTNTSLKVKT